MTYEENEIVAEAGMRMAELIDRCQAQVLHNTLPRSFAALVSLEISGIRGLLSALPLEAEGEE